MSVTGERIKNVDSNLWYATQQWAWLDLMTNVPRDLTRPDGRTYDVSGVSVAITQVLTDGMTAARLFEGGYYSSEQFQKILDGVVKTYSIVTGSRNQVDGIVIKRYQRARLSYQDLTGENNYQDPLLKVPRIKVPRLPRKRFAKRFDWYYG